MNEDFKIARERLARLIKEAADSREFPNIDRRVESLIRKATPVHNVEFPLILLNEIGSLQYDNPVRLKNLLGFIASEISALEMNIDDHLKSKFEEECRSLNHEQMKIIALAQENGAVFFMDEPNEIWSVAENSVHSEENGTIGTYDTLVEAANEYVTKYLCISLPETDTAEPEVDVSPAAR